MRPVNKGKAPEVEYKDYKDAEPELEISSSVNFFVSILSH